jgi:Rrf2 family transcriptional regulator, iron-sulfur cluster assembly transcription factor
MFSTSCHYGLQAMLYIAVHGVEGKHIDLRQIAEEQDIPRHFLSKIMQQLVRDGLVISMKGPTGGFRLSKPPEKISLLQIVDAIDGMDVFTQCGMGFKKCNDQKPCPIHHEYKKVRERIEELFRTQTLKKLTEDVRRGDSIVSLGR